MGKKFSTKNILNTFSLLKTDEEKSDYINEVLNYAREELNREDEVSLCAFILESIKELNQKEGFVSVIYMNLFQIKDVEKRIKLGSIILKHTKDPETKETVSEKILVDLNDNEYFLDQSFIMETLNLIKEYMPERSNSYKEADIQIEDIIFLQSDSQFTKKHLEDLEDQLKYKLENGGRMTKQEIYHVACQLLTSKKNPDLAIKGLNLVIKTDQFKHRELATKMLEWT